MKKLNTIERLTLDMHKREDRIFQDFEIVTDSEIISKIEAVNDIDETDYAGRTLLINAVFTKRIKVAEYLLKRGAAVNFQDKRKYTALHFAANKGNIEMIKLFVKHGADINAKNISGDTPLMLCPKSSSKEIFMFFMKHGADPYIKNKLGVSAFDIFKHDYYIIELFSNL